MTPNELQTAVEELEALVNTGNNHAEAETQARLLLAEAGIENEPELHCKVLLALTVSFWKRHRIQDSLDTAQQLLTLATPIQNTFFEAKALLHIGNAHWRLSNYTHALEHYSKALPAFESLGMGASVAQVIGNLGNVYSDMGDFPRALENYVQALALNESLGDRRGIASSYCNIGTVYINIGNYIHALEYMSRALVTFEELGEKSGIASVTGNIGILYSNLGDYTRALEYYTRALAAHEELGDKSSVAIWTGNTGLVYSSLGDYPRAIEYMNRAISAHEELGEKSKIAAITGNIGNMYRQLNNYPRALDYYSRALAAHEEHGEKSGIALIMLNIGELYAREEFGGNDTAKAEEYLLKSLAIFEEIGAKNHLYENHKNLAELYKKQERWKEFGIHYEKYHELKEQVQSEEAKKQADRLDYERKTAEREKQLAIERAAATARIDEQQKLIHNVLPPSIADRLLNNETFIADSYPNVSVLFMDLVNFTRIAAIIPPRHLIYLLNTIFSNADAVMEKHGLEKIKTIGDAYMAVAGAPVHQDDHAQRAALAALDVMEAMNNLSVTIPEELGETSWTEHVGEIQVRIGLHCGEAIGGVIGDKKFTFDLWGDAVNTAARMESHGEAGKIHVSEEFVNQLTMDNGKWKMKQDAEKILLSIDNYQLSIIPRGEMEIKGKGMMRTCFLERAQ